jgi:hypothetical protein
MQAIISSPMTSGTVRESMAVAAEFPSRQQRIRWLNDNMRATFTSGRVMLTTGVTALEDEDQASVLLAVSAFDGFTPTIRTASMTSAGLRSGAGGTSSRSTITT